MCVQASDYSAAFFATGNVAISRRRLQEAIEPPEIGPFDTGAPCELGILITKHYQAL